jgi:hypothetical protein
MAKAGSTEEYRASQVRLMDAKTARTTGFPTVKFK